MDDDMNDQVTMLCEKATSGLARVEKEFNSTVVLTENNTFLFRKDSIKAKRNAKLPTKYRNDMILETDTLPKSFRSLKHNTEDQQSKISNNNYQSSTNQASYPILGRLPHLTVNLVKIPGLESLEIWCMEHSLYRCFCRGGAGVSRTDMKENKTLIKPVVPTKADIVPVKSITPTLPIKPIRKRRVSVNQKRYVETDNENDLIDIETIPTTNKRMSLAPLLPKSIEVVPSSTTARFIPINAQFFLARNRINAPLIRKEIINAEDKISLFKERLQYLQRKCEHSEAISNAKRKQTMIVKRKSNFNLGSCQESFTTLRRPPVSKFKKQSSPQIMLPPERGSPVANTTSLPSAHDLMQPSTSTISDSNESIATRYVPKLNALITDQMNNICNMQRKNVHVFPGPALNCLNSFHWDQLLKLYIADIVFVWEICNMDGSIFVAMTTTNRMPIVKNATSIVNIKAVHSLNLRMLMTKMLNLKMNNESTRKVSILVFGGVSFWHITGYLRSSVDYFNGGIFAKPTPSTHPLLAKKINNVYALLFTAHIKRDLKNKTKISNVRIQRNTIKDMKSIFLSIPQIGDSRWFMLNFQEDFSDIYIPTWKSLLRYEKIIRSINIAAREKKTVQMNNEQNELPYVFATPTNTNQIFFGPYRTNENINIVLYQQLDGELLLREEYERRLNIKRTSYTEGCWLFVGNKYSDKVESSNEVNDPQLTDDNIKCAGQSIVNDLRSVNCGNLDKAAQNSDVQTSFVNDCIVIDDYEESPATEEPKLNEQSLPATKETSPDNKQTRSTVNNTSSSSSTTKSVSLLKRKSSVSLEVQESQPLNEATLSKLNDFKMTRTRVKVVPQINSDLTDEIQPPKRRKSIFENPIKTSKKLSKRRQSYCAPGTLKPLIDSSSSILIDDSQSLSSEVNKSSLDIQENDRVTTPSRRKTISVDESIDKTKVTTKFKLLNKRRQSYYEPATSRRLLTPSTLIEEKTVAKPKVQQPFHYASKEVPETSSSCIEKVTTAKSALPKLDSRRQSNYAPETVKPTVTPTQLNENTTVMNDKILNRVIASSHHSSATTSSPSHEQRTFTLTNHGKSISVTETTPTFIANLPKSSLLMPEKRKMMIKRRQSVGATLHSTTANHQASTERETKISKIEEPTKSSVEKLNDTAITVATPKICARKKKRCASFCAPGTLSAPTPEQIRRLMDPTEPWNADVLTDITQNSVIVSKDTSTTTATKKDFVEPTKNSVPDRGSSNTLKVGENWRTFFDNINQLSVNETVKKVTRLPTIQIKSIAKKDQPQQAPKTISNATFNLMPVRRESLQTKTTDSETLTRQFLVRNSEQLFVPKKLTFLKSHKIIAGYEVNSIPARKESSSDNFDTETSTRTFLGRKPEPQSVVPSLATALKTIPTSHTMITGYELKSTSSKKEVVITSEVILNSNSPIKVILPQKPLIGVLPRPSTSRQAAATSNTIPKIGPLQPIISSAHLAQKFSPLQVPATTFNSLLKTSSLQQASAKISAPLTKPSIPPLLGISKDAVQQKPVTSISEANDITSAKTDSKSVPTVVIKTIVPKDPPQSSASCVIELSDDDSDSDALVQLNDKQQEIINWSYLTKDSQVGWIFCSIPQVGKVPCQRTPNYYELKLNFMKGTLKLPRMNEVNEYINS